MNLLNFFKFSNQVPSIYACQASHFSWAKFCGTLRIPRTWGYSVYLDNAKDLERTGGTGVCLFWVATSCEYFGMNLIDLQNSVAWFMVSRTSVASACLVCVCHGARACACHIWKWTWVRMKPKLPWRLIGTIQWYKVGLLWYWKVWSKNRSLFDSIDFF